MKDIMGACVRESDIESEKTREGEREDAKVERVCVSMRERERERTR